MVSFYSLPSSVLKSDKHKDLRAAYTYYHAYTSVSQKVSFLSKELLQDALIFA